ncbi:TcaA second domain-containing protein [Staphylococcus cohnii]|uniref:TcaA second domain-containing protein n=1 Tax=Staphylococcus cohnii TaxID=29382 RepID=UPI00186741A5|nr:zinc-ribbon domain-containing protein [Staphylococcus cohnii]
MKYCSNCGAEIKPGQRVCTQCGTPIQQRATNQSPNHKSKWPLFIIIAVILVILIALFVAYKIIDAQLSPTKQAETIAKDFKNKDTDRLASHLKSNGEAISKDEAKAIYKYIDETDSVDRVADELQSSAKNIKENKLNEQTVTVGDTSLINITEDGKKWGIFKNYIFNVNEEPVSITSEEDTTLSYKLNDKTTQVKLKQGKTKTLDDFPIGIYDLKATQKVDNKKFDGVIHIDMSESNSADLQFKQKRFTVSIDSSFADSDSLKLYINGNEQSDFDEYESVTYGPYAPDEKVEVYATTEVEGKQFKSSVENVSSPNDDEDEIDVALTFDDDAISDYEDKMIEKEADSDDDDDSTSNSDEKVTRDNVIDKVESYEGSTLDTDNYTYKEPEKTGDGWGFSFTDKDGELAGSYKIDEDGYVTEYDEDGEEVDSGY